MERPSAPAAVADTLPPGPALGDLGSLVRDERGVRLAREPEEAD